MLRFVIALFVVFAGPLQAQERTSFGRIIPPGSVARMGPIPVDTESQPKISVRDFVEMTPDEAVAYIEAVRGTMSWAIWHISPEEAPMFDGNTGDPLEWEPVTACLFGDDAWSPEQIQEGARDWFDRSGASGRSAAIYSVFQACQGA